MNKIFIITLLFCIVLPASQAKKKQTPVANGKGFYKDIFMDSGINLTSRTDLYAARFLNKSIEYFASGATNNQNDTIVQTMLITGYPIDENGVLLYPDGAPRFRMIYMNGGRATRHGRSLMESGRKNIQDFIAHGGSYVGTCAGAYLTCKYFKDDTDSVPLINTRYLHIWPGTTSPCGMIQKRHGVVFEKNSALLNYFDFGGDNRVDSVYHNGGCWGNMAYNCPEGTQVLARYDTRMVKGHEEITGKPVIWTYKPNAQSGRIIASGSHPEKENGGERMQLMAAMMLYAMDGNGEPQIKGTLELGKERKMNKFTHNSIPEYTAIGDKQYHHYIIDVPEGLDTLTFSLKSLPKQDNFDMHICASTKGLAWMDEAEYHNLDLGFDKCLRINKPKAGRYYVSVYCATTVDTFDTPQGPRYKGRLDVLNGVPYIIGANLPKPKETKK